MRMAAFAQYSDARDCVTRLSRARGGRTPGRLATPLPKTQASASEARCGGVETK